MMFPVAGKLTCRKCGATKAAESQVIRDTEKPRDDKSLFIEDPGKYAMQIHPIDDQVSCGKCGNLGAYYYLRQTRKSDEPTTAFYTCTRCSNKWRHAR